MEVILATEVVEIELQIKLVGKEIRPIESKIDVEPLVPI